MQSINKLEDRLGDLSLRLNLVLAARARKQGGQSSDNGNENEKVEDPFTDLFKIFDNIKDDFEQKFVKKSEYRASQR